MKELSLLNQNSTNYVNLGEFSECYDTYQISTHLFYNYIKNNKKFIKYQDKNLFDIVMHRILIKNVGTIVPYSAGFKCRWKKYVKNLVIKNKNIVIDDVLKALIYGFFRFIKKDIQKLYFYKEESALLIKKFSKNFEQSRKLILESVW